MNVLVIGSGAVGGFYGSLLARSGVRVAVVARSDYEAIQAHGIEVTSEAGLGHAIFRPAAVLRHGGELAEKPDYVLLCVKVAGPVDRVGLLRGALGPDTAIVLVCNGVEIEDEIARAFPQHELVSGLAFVCVTRVGPGKIWHQAYGNLVLGNYPRGLSEKTRALCWAFESSGIRCIASSDIVAARWQKCVWNAAFNPLSVLSGGLSTAAILETREPFVRALMDEICRIAAALGYPLPANLVDQQVDSTRRMPPYKTSMLLDFEAGRPLETEAILGHAVRAGRRAGVPIPYLESVYARMTRLESKRPQG